MISNSYNHRMDFEKTIMRSEMPQFRFYQNVDSYYFEGWQRTSTLNRSYMLKLILSRWYPDERPKLYVTSPINLKSYISWKTINQIGVAHKSHTLSNGPNGCVQICHFKDEHWDASQTCVGVFTKGLLWLEAYENHLLTGNEIAEILYKWKRRQ